MRQEIGPYIRHSFADEDECVVIEVKEVPAGWKPILDPQGPGITLATTLAALLVWVVVAIRAINTFAT